LLASSSGPVGNVGHCFVGLGPSQMRHGDILSYFLPDGHKKSGIFSIVQKTDQKYFLWGALVLSIAKKAALST
jgi:hypothetical protein